jgi:hypothetical protein
VRINEELLLLLNLALQLWVSLGLFDKQSLNEELLERKVAAPV